jgi:ferredoxin
MRRLRANLPGVGHQPGARQSRYRRGNLHRLQELQQNLFLRSRKMSKTVRTLGLAIAVALVAGLACVKSLEQSLGPTKGAYLSVDPGLCSGCRKCVAVCNADAITIVSNKAVVDPTKCNQCFKCVDACPYDAIY